jgi:hypothetical protein
MRERRKPHSCAHQSYSIIISIMPTKQLASSSHRPPTRGVKVEWILSVCTQQWTSQQIHQGLILLRWVLLIRKAWRRCVFVKYLAFLQSRDDMYRKLGIAISPNVLSLSTLDNNTTTFSFVSPRYRCCIAIFVSLNNKFCFYS